MHRLNSFLCGDFVDLSVKSDVLLCTIANGKNEFVTYREDSPDISKVNKRPELIYPPKHDLKLFDEGNFIVVSLSVKLKGNKPEASETLLQARVTKTIQHEMPQPAYR